MLTLSYNRSVVLQQTIKHIEEVRQRILFKSLSPRSEHRLVWEAHIERIYYALHLSHDPITKKDIVRLLSQPAENGNAVNYKRAIDLLRIDWLMQEKPLMPATVKSLYHLVTGEKLSISDALLMEVLVFLQTSSEHPFIQAYISYFQFLSLFPQTDNGARAARIFPYLFLYKYGIHFRGLLVLEKYFYTHERLLRDLLLVIEQKETITPWLEHFVQGVLTMAEETEQSLAQEHSAIMPPAFWELTERQKDILSLFDKPGLRITNKAVQKAYTISQITASRDLAKLTTLGFLFPYGKGRSVYYIKV